MRASTLVFADPPYNLQLEKRSACDPTTPVVDGVHHDWDKFTSFAAYDALLARLAGGMPSVSSNPTAHIWVIGSYHNIFRLGVSAAGSRLSGCRTTSSGARPIRCRTFRGKRFTNAHETMIWAGRRAVVTGDLQLRGDEGVRTMIFKCARTGCFRSAQGRSA